MCRNATYFERQKSMAKHPVIDSLAEKVERVIQENTRLGGVCKELTAEKDNLKAENRALKEKVDELQRKLNLMELGEGLAGTNDAEGRKRARAQINKLMREIDRCIALVGK